MNLNFISSEELHQFDVNKHFGMFVYLMNDYEGYKYGLYFGGINGWERLTNDAFIKYISVNAPIASSIIFTYNGTNLTYYPANWENIEDYCTLYNNTAINAGTYQVEIDLNDTEKYVWADTDASGSRTLNWVINPYNLTSDHITATLNKTEMTYGDDEPYVSSVICNEVFKSDGSTTERALIANSEYLVTAPSDFNVGTKQFKVELTGDFANNYTCDPIYLNVVVNKKKIDLPTNLNQEVDYNYASPVTYNPTPDNWSDISSYCTINGEKNIKDVDVYTYTIKLNDTDNYCWADGSVNDQTLTFTIKYNGVEKPTDNKVDWTYNASEYAWYPSNWDSIKDYCNITGNTATNPGTYTAVVSLKEDAGKTWIDGSSDSIEFTWEIKKATEVTITLEANGTDLVQVDDTNYTMTYNKDNRPKVVVRNANGDILTEGTDYNVAYPADYNVGNKSYTILLEGNYNGWKSVYLTILPIVIDVPTDSSEIYIYNTSEQTWLPGNWDSIKEYCSISGNTETNAGTYLPIISLNDNVNYKWSDNTTDDQVKSFVINKAEGTVSVNISGDLTYGSTITANATSNSDGAMTYQWYKSSTPYSTESEGGTLDEDYTTDSLKIEALNKYYRVEVNVAESDNYTECVGYAITTTPSGKKTISLKFESNSGTALLSDGTYLLPSLNQPSDDDGVLTYTSSDESIGTIIAKGGKKYIKINAVGEVTITATVPDSTLYEYESNTDTFTLAITSSIDAYWGFTEYWKDDIIVEEGAKKLKDDYLVNGILPTNKIQATLTDNADGSESFTLSSSEYMSYNATDSDTYPQPCNIWWFAIPVGKSITYMNVNSMGDVSSLANGYLIKNSDVVDDGNSDGYVVTMNGIDYNIYSKIDSMGACAYPDSIYKIDITIK